MVLFTSETKGWVLLIEKLVPSIAKILWDIPMPFAVLFTGFYFTVENKLFQLRYLRHLFQQIVPQISYKHERARQDGALSSFNAANIALGCLVGVGCIGGVATAISIGGPGAVFWMWIAALAGMIIKIAEVTLSVYYRRANGEGKIIGGPTVYIEKGIGKELGVKSWKILVGFFVAGIIVPIFLSIQNYGASYAVHSTFGTNMLVASFLFALLVYLMIMRGTHYLGKIFRLVVPIMILAYVALGSIVIIMNLEKVIPALELIMKHAFLGTAAIGGFAGATLSQVITMGVSQAVYSSEFGWGTTPIIHSTANVNHPVKQGLWGGFEVFLTTIVICGITAFVVIISGDWTSGRSGIDLALHSFELTLGAWGRYIVTVILCLFALTSASGWYVHRKIMVNHVLEKKPALKKQVLRYLKLLCALPEFILVLYAVMFHFPDKLLWLLTGIMTAIPTFINIFVLLILSNQFKRLLQDYKARYMKIGKIDEEADLFYEKRQHYEATAGD